MELGFCVLGEFSDDETIDQFLRDKNSRHEAEVNENGLVDGFSEKADHGNFYQISKKVPAQVYLK